MEVAEVETLAYKSELKLGWGRLRMWREETEERVGEIFARILLPSFGTLLHTRSFGDIYFEATTTVIGATRKQSISPRHLFFFLQLLCLFFEIDMMDGYNDRNKSLIPLRFSMSSLLSSYPDFTSSFCVHI